MSDDLHPAEIAKLEAETAYYEYLSRTQRVKAEVQEKEWADARATEYENRIYTFDSAVSKSSAQNCISQLGMWVRRDPSKPIKVVFNSPGGSVFDGLALYDYIQTIRGEGTKVDTVALGMAASMGGVLLQAGEERVMSPSAYLLIHEVSTGTIGKVSEIEDEAKLAKELYDRCVEILARRSTLTSRQIQNRAKRRDWWLSAEKALELGFCDAVR